MIKTFKGPYKFDKTTLENWDSNEIGVYYCGVKTNEGKLTIYYIGRAIGEGGIRDRLLQHLSENKWYDVTHFGYEGCDTSKEAIDHESSEIEKYKPKYNTQGK
jgi:excinuclease UvrABC nuclease subunit